MSRRKSSAATFPPFRRNSSRRDSNEDPNPGPIKTPGILARLLRWFWSPRSVPLVSLLSLNLGYLILDLVDHKAQTLEIQWLEVIYSGFSRVSTASGLALVFPVIVTGAVELLLHRDKSWTYVGLFYSSSTLVGSLTGLLFALWFRPTFAHVSFNESMLAFASQTDPGIPLFEFHCGNVQALVMNETSSVVECQNISHDSRFLRRFLAIDLNGVLGESVGARWGLFRFRTLGQGVRSVLEQLVPSNLVFGFTTGNTLSMISMALIIGLSLASMLSQEHESSNSTSCSSPPVSSGALRSRNDPSTTTPRISSSSHNYALYFFQQLTALSLAIARLVLTIVPLHVISIVLFEMFRHQTNWDWAFHVGLMSPAWTCILVLALASTTHMFLSFLTLAWVTRSCVIPVKFYWKARHALCYSFMTSSSLQSLPLTYVSAERGILDVLLDQEQHDDDDDGTTEDQLSEHDRASLEVTSRTVLTLGAVVHKPGTALFFPIAMLFLVETSGWTGFDGVSAFVKLVCVSIVSSVACPALPEMSLFYLSSVWRVHFPAVGLPPSYGLIYGCSPVAERLQTLVNVWGDLTCVGVLMHTQIQDMLKKKKKRKKKKRKKKKQELPEADDRSEKVRSDEKVRKMRTISDVPLLEQTDDRLSINDILT